MNKERSILFENVFSLFSLQIFNYILPLLTLPYLTRVLGIENYGLLAFAGAFIQYFNTLIDYGYNVSATKLISIHRNDNIIVSDIFNSIFAIKSIFVISCLIIYLPIIYFIPKFRNDIYLYLISYSSVVGNLLFPVWFYQGLEKMKIIAAVNAISKTVATILIFVLVKKSYDLNIAAAIQSISVITAGVISFIMVKRFYPKLSFYIPKRAAIVQNLKNGWPIFVSLLSVSLISNSNVFILGIISTNKMVGYLSIAIKIVWAVVNMINPISNAIFPRVSFLFQDSREKAMRFIAKVIRYSFIIFIIFSISIFIFSDTLVLLATGTKNSYLSILIKIISFFPAFIYIDNILGMQIMLNLGMEKKYMAIYILAAIYSIVAAFLFAASYKAIGIAINYVITEIIVITLMFINVKKQITVQYNE